MFEVPKVINKSGNPTPRTQEKVRLTDNGCGTFSVFDGSSIRHGFQWGKRFNISYTYEPGFPYEDALRAVRKRVVSFTNSLGMNGEDTVLAHAVYGKTNIVYVDSKSDLIFNGERGYYTHEGGAFFTVISGLPLYSLISDCTQTIFYAEKENGSVVAGLIHSGRAEANMHFPANAVINAIDRYRLDPRKIKLGIAPSLEPKHHTIEQEHARKLASFVDFMPYMIHSIEEAVYHFDLRSYVADQYIQVGIPAENIELCLAGIYTLGNKNKAASHRRSVVDGIPRIGHGIAVEIT